MKLANLELGDTILVKLIDTSLDTLDSITEFLCTCWPLSQIDPSQISINKNLTMLNGIKSDSSTNLLVIKPEIESKKSIADEVDIEFVRSLSSTDLFDEEQDLNEKENDDLEMIMNFLKEIYLNKFIMPGQCLNLTYMGQKLVFKIIYIGSNRETSEVNLSKKLEKSLHLDEEKSRKNSIWQSGLNNKEESVDLIRKLTSHELKLYTVKNGTRFSIIKNVDLNKTDSDFENALVKSKKFTFNDIGGLEKEMQLLREFFIDPFRFDELYKQIGVEFSKGVLLFGPGGCGKTMLARAVCNESKCSHVELNISDIYSRFFLF